MRYRHLDLAALGYTATILVVFGIEPFINVQKLIFGDDLHLTYYFFRSYFKNSLDAGVFPWWNPYLFGGYPYAAHPQTLQMFYPIHWLFAVFPVSVMFAWYLAGHILIAMLGMYFAASRFMRREAAFVSGIVFGLSGFFMARIWAGHVDMIAAAAYLPWVFIFFWRAMNSGKMRDIVIAAISLTVQIFVGYQTVALFTLEAVGIAAAILSLSAKSIRPIMRMLAAIVLGVGLAAAQLIPQQEFVNRSIRTFPFPYEWASGQHLVREQLKTLLNPFLYGDQRTYAGPWPNLAEYAMYVGLLPLGLAIVALLIGLAQAVRQVRDDNKIHSPIIVLIFFAIALFGLWISFAVKAPYDLMHFFWKYIPVYHSLRIPVRHLLLLVFGLSALSGLSIGWARSKLFAAVVAILVLIDLVPFARTFMELRDIPELRHDPKLVNFLKADTSIFRTSPMFGVWLEPRSSFDFDSAMTYKLFSTTGYDPSILRNYYEFIDASGGHTNPSFLEHNVQVPYLDINSPYMDFLNVKYVFVPNWLDPLGGIPSGPYTLVFDDPARGYRLYENKEVMPRFFQVSDLATYPNRDMIKTAIINGTVDLTGTVLTSEPVTGFTPAPCSETDPGDAEVISYTPNEIKLRVDAACDAFLVSSEVYYPGWEATVDGMATTVFEGNMAFRVIQVPQGTHEIVFRYIPKIFIIGGGVSILFILVAGYLWRRKGKLV